MASERDPRPRHHLQTPIAFWGPEVEGGGKVANISASGALIEPAFPPVRPGTRLTLAVPYFPRTHVEIRSVELQSEVVRATDSGFAVLFKDLDSEATSLLKELLQPEVIDLVDEI
jgi:hypothetical protein